MSEQEIQVLLRQILDGQKRLIEEMKGIHRHLERLESKFVTSEKSDSLPDRHIVPVPMEIPLLTRTSEAEQIWSKVCDIIQERISRPSFETWVKPTEARGINEKKLYISCANDFARDWLSSRYASLVEECLDTLETDLKTVEFVWIPSETRDNIQK
ncbi:DnaA N-terminal domain-containing protein [Thermoactinomyces sp. CICC 23799]|jgi:hypothetical protein|uniref:DnaA N-terminal domain-containing protein n=1 Tax=Thermoactinomyces sp. CICC 23799 TaxID=2767429 RepID=UPI0018DC44E5|nr:DnaA N-terminal domain-containing protein [Thermoactinomyces sp. CICC 23799]MBH8601386.1 hypothetical protein [Thermoactinomyces sp. CICC 23799]